MKNFNYPYLSRSIIEFWRRWHISLSSWFRDYLYIPLGGNRCSSFRWVVNVFIVFSLSGLWHGANWTFFIWGVFHAVLIMISKPFSKIKNRIYSFCRVNQNSFFIAIIEVLFVFHIVLFSWIFFRANTVKDAFYIINHLFTNVLYTINHLNQLGQGGSLIGYGNFQTLINLILAAFFIITAEILHKFNTKNNIINFVCSQNIVMRWSLYYACILLLFFFAVRSQTADFLYFQF